jgi:hypothetical protein
VHTARFEDGVRDADFGALSPFDELRVTARGWA